MMSADKRTVATDALETLGTAPLDERQKRDAIHLAVEPVIAGERMNAGDHITVVDGTAWRAEEGENAPPLGIVDPFLRRPVKKGERFWFIMYPRMVTSLRHVWAHPAFPDEAGASPQPAAPAIDKAASERWLREFIGSADCPDYDTLMKLIDKGSMQIGDTKYYGESTVDRDYIHIAGEDAHGEIPPEFWTHAEIVLGRKLRDHPTSFSCSC